MKKCPHEEDDQNQAKAVFDEGESIKITADPRSFAPPRSKHDSCSD